MTPLDYYNEQICKGMIVEDQRQLAVLDHLQNIYVDVLREHRQRSRCFALLRKPKAVKGAYLWGGVGIGKTFIMDCFYQSIPFDNKMRIHFHQFMKYIHLELKKYQGEKNPLQLIAKEISKKAMILCFDELFVSDITDAMILARLFTSIISQGVCLIATSNVMPDDLYKKGLQRELFLPAIALIKQVTNVIHVPTVIDYRLLHLKNASVFYIPNDQIANQNMEKSFSILSDSKYYTTNDVNICDRHIQIIKQVGDTIWFDFNSICSVPRSHHDYLAIAEKYSTVFISNIPKISSNMKNTISLFIRMVDIFYDAGIRLVCSAEDEVENIYIDGHMIFEYARTRSRLLEMQSESYFSQISRRKA